MWSRCSHVPVPTTARTVYVWQHAADPRANHQRRGGAEALMNNDEDIAEKLYARRFAAEEAAMAAEVAGVIADGTAT